MFPPLCQPRKRRACRSVLPCKQRIHAVFDTTFLASLRSVEAARTRFHRVPTAQHRTCRMAAPNNQLQATEAAPDLGRWDSACRRTLQPPFRCAASRRARTMREASARWHRCGGRSPRTEVREDCSESQRARLPMSLPCQPSFLISVPTSGWRATPLSRRASAGAMVIARRPFRQSVPP